MTLTLSPIAISTSEGNIHWPRSPACCMCNLSQFSHAIVTSEAYQAFRDTRASYDALANLLETIGRFLNRLDIYNWISPTAPMTEIIVKIMVELLSTFAVVTNHIKQKQLSESGLTDMHDMQLN